MSLYKNEKKTAACKFSERFSTWQVNLIRYKTLRNFVHSFDPSLIPFQPRFCKLFGDKGINDVSILVLASAELISFPYILSQVTGQKFMTTGQTRRNKWNLQDLNKIHFKNKKFSCRQLKIYYIFRSSQVGVGLNPSNTS